MLLSDNDLTLILAASPLNLACRPRPEQLRAAVVDQLLRHGGLDAARDTCSYDCGRYPQAGRLRLARARRLVSQVGASYLQPGETPVDDPRALTCYLPWSDLVAYVDKRIENRTYQTHWRSSLIVHAGLERDESLIATALTVGHDLPGITGAFVATARIVGCHRAQQDTGGRWCCQPYGFPHVWHWELASVRPLAQPVPAVGGRGLWRPAPHLLAAVRAAENGGA